ncbi:chlorohydrolase [Streptococcus pneumoniae]|nr:chlorohydrolase [Streptococcus pneumoniae]
MKIKEETSKLVADCQSHCFEVVDRTDNRFEVVDKTDVYNPR